MSGYEGQIATIGIGSYGLLTDESPVVIPAGKMLRLKNITLTNRVLEKDYGSKKWNSSALAGGIMGFIDWWPDAATQRVVALCKDGKLYKFRYYYSSAEITAATSTEPSSLITVPYANFLSAGGEQSGSSKKLFLFTGKYPVQVLAADGTTRTNLLNPPSDWSGSNQPIFGLIYRSRVWAFGNENDPHRVYVSLATNHEDFTTALFQFQIYPGVSERLISAFIYKERLFFLKFPTGLFILDDTNEDTAFWKILPVNLDVGGASPMSIMAMLDDIYFANNYGGVTSLKSSAVLAGFEMADIFYQMAIEKMIATLLSQFGGNERHCLNYQAGKTLYITYRSAGGIRNDRLVQVNITREGPEASLIEKDQPNCLALIKDSFSVGRPFYGSEDGFIYEMGRMDRNVDSAAYRGEFFSHHMDFSQGNLNQAEMMKSFEFLEFVYIPTGNWNFNYEVHIDGQVQSTGTFKLDDYGTKSELDTMALDTAMTSSDCPMSKRFKIGGQGRRIAIRGYNETANQNFKIVRINIYFKYTNLHQVVK